MLAVFGRIDPHLRRSITFDNDTAFAQHALLRTMRGTAPCDPTRAARFRSPLQHRMAHSITEIDDDTAAFQTV
jgi:hypothetical protein